MLTEQSDQGFLGILHPVHILYVHNLAKSSSLTLGQKRLQRELIQGIPSTFCRENYRYTIFTALVILSM